MKDDEVLKNWLLIVRQGRILLDKDHLLLDEFHTNKTLSKWLGLNYIITNDEGSEVLRETIVRELELGIGRLPKWFGHYFSTTQIVEEDTITQKTWLVNVRKGRNRYDKGNLFYDEFTNPGAFRDWLGL